jgi:hypothetical protein
MNRKHLAVCGALVGIGVIAVVSGAELLGVLAVAGCALMMGAMVWMMVKAGAGGH